MRHFFTLGLLCLVCTGVCGQSLLKDINSFLSPDNSPAPDVKPVAIGSTVYFVANDGINGFELWKTNGTAAGTSLVRDIFPGPDDSYPKWLVEVNGILYFSANDGLHGVELWKSDGTAQGTVMVRNIVPSSTGSNPEYLINNNGILYFAAGGEPNITYLPDRELWRSDGTAAGTVLVKNINPSYSSEPASLVSHKGEVYFSADINGSRQVWKSDGTAAGTVLLPGDVSLGTTPLVSSGDYVYFTALVPGNGTELCKTDGLTAGLVKNIHPTGNSTPSLLTDVNGTLFFVAADASGNTREVWKSDGTEAGTVMVKDIYTGTTVNAPPSSLVNVNGTLFFVAYESATGSELWKSDGTEAGTVMVKDILPSTSSNSHSQLVNVAGTLFFSGRDNSGNELWKSDG
ncbi:MAG TPA: ELWxxDGT repeat protein, partial [Flavisolibacter sp.]|nr:ELWxxDGT repeat protein [Flavisolibacter sp.]